MYGEVNGNKTSQIKRTVINSEAQYQTKINEKEAEYQRKITQKELEYERKRADKEKDYQRKRADKIKDYERKRNDKMAEWERKQEIKDNKLKHKIFDSNVKTMISFGALGMAAIGITGLDLDSSKQQQYNNQIYEVAEAAIKPDTKSLSEMQSEALKETAKSYSASYILNDLSDCMTYEEQQHLNNKYDDKYLEITGVVNQTHLNSIDGNFFTIINDNPDSYVTSWGKMYCYVEDEEDINAMKYLETGDKVTIVGESQLNTVFFDVNDCDIKKINGKELGR